MSIPPLKVPGGGEIVWLSFLIVADAFTL